MDVIAGELVGENPLAAAVHVLKACGVYRLAAPLSQTDPEAEELEVAARERERTLEEEATFAALR